MANNKIEGEPGIIPRIYGTEIEYGQMVNGSTDIPTEYFSQLPFHLNQTRTRSGMTRNGARIYQDIGEHPEYATAECSTLEEVIAAEIAGEKILKATLANLAVCYPKMTYRLQKRTIDSAHHNYGAHESYLVDSSVSFRENQERAAVLIESLAVHYVSRMALVGGGFYDLSEADWRVSQRAPCLNSLAESSCYKPHLRPLVDTRYEPLADPTRWRRLHVSHGDPNISPWALRTKIGMTSAFVRLIENNIPLDDLFLRSPVRAARMVGADTSLKQKLELHDGRYMTALEIQAELAERLLDIDDATPILPADERQVVEQVLVDSVLAAKDPDHLIFKADWKTNMEIVESKVDYELCLEDYITKSAKYDLAYSLVAYKPKGALEPIEGSGIQLRDLGKFGAVDEAAVEKLQQFPPSSTRARVRGALIAAQGNKAIRQTLGYLKESDWANLRFVNQLDYFRLADPYQTIPTETMCSILDNAGIELSN